MVMTLLHLLPHGTLPQFLEEETLQAEKGSRDPAGGA